MSVCCVLSLRIELITLDVLIDSSDEDICSDESNRTGANEQANAKHALNSTDNSRAQQFKRQAEKCE